MLTLMQEELQEQGIPGTNFLSINFESKAVEYVRSWGIERCFADAKEKPGMRYTLVRSLSQVAKWVRLKFVAMNLKKYALHAT